jgi:hypothetical protein
MEIRPLLFGLLIAWGAVTAALVAILAYRSRLEVDEEDQVFLSESEERMAREQRRLVSSIEKLTKPITVLTVTSASLLVVTGGIWLWHLFTNF